MSKEATSPCLCGCGKKPKRLFVQGHDMKLRSLVVRAYRSGEKAPKLDKLQRDYLKTAYWVDADMLKYLGFRKG